MDSIKLQAAIELAGASWQAGETSMTQLSDAEKQLRLGYTPGPNEPSFEEQEQIAKINQEVFKSAQIKGETAGYPASFDMRTGGFVTPVKDQGSCGSCVAFGTVATIETTIRRLRNNPALAIDLSEAHLFYCYARALGRNCGNGWWVPPSMDSAKTGLAIEASYPYTAADQNCSNLASNWQSSAVKISGWHEIQSIADMKEWLATRGALAACFTVYTDFFAYKSGIYRQVSGKVEGGHCVSIVGYNDTEGYWIAKNSWGENFGENGFFRIAYGQCGIDSSMFAVDGIVETGWLSNVKILGLWTNNADRNAYVYVSEGIGWRKLSDASDQTNLDMLIQLAASKAGDRAVSLYQENGIIKEIYAW